MATDDMPARPIVDATSPIFVAAVQKVAEQRPNDGGDKSGIGLRELLITVLAPTLALIGVAVGVWDNARREDAARRRDEDIRVAGLVLPYYQEVMKASDAVEFAEGECAAAWDGFDDAALAQGGRDDAFSTIDRACGKDFRSALAGLDSALNQALLVSNRDLLPVVEQYQELQTRFAAIATWLNSEDPFGSVDSLELSDEELEQQLNDFEAEFQQTAEVYVTTVEELDSVRRELVAVVREQVLLQSNQ